MFLSGYMQSWLSEVFAKQSRLIKNSEEIQRYRKNWEKLRSALLVKWNKPFRNQPQWRIARGDLSLILFSPFLIVHFNWQSSHPCKLVFQCIGQLLTMLQLFFETSRYYKNFEQLWHRPNDDWWWCNLVRHAEVFDEPDVSSLTISRGASSTFVN